MLAQIEVLMATIMIHPHDDEGSNKLWSMSTRLHGAVPQKTVIFRNGADC
jgi:hypothetical protein